MWASGGKGLQNRGSKCRGPEWGAAERLAGVSGSGRGTKLPEAGPRPLWTLYIRLLKPSSNLRRQGTSPSSPPACRGLEIEAAHKATISSV